MPDQAPNIEPGARGRLRYDKERRTIVGETRTVHDPFLNKDVQVSNRLTDRLRGRYANGPTLANGEPEFGWREFPTPPIQKEAAAEIERLTIENWQLKGALGYAVPGDIPQGDFKCGLCDARAKQSPA